MKNTLKFFILIMLIGLFSTTCDINNGGEICSHTWEWVVTTAPTDFGDGEKTETCSKCSETRGKESVLATGIVQIPAGTFTMGPDLASNNDTTFTATLSAFKMSKYLVTQEQYQEVMGNNPSYFNGGPTGGDDYFSRETAEGEVQGKRPVETVTWFDAIEFCNKLSVKEGFNPVYTITERTPETGYPITFSTVTVNWTANGYRLPTDAQWEYACRAGSTTDYYFGDDVTKLEEYAWYSENSNSMTHQVGKKKPNDFGLYDMHGNVFEWCWDWWGDYPTEAKTDYTGAVAGTHRVQRNGSFFTTYDLVSAYRDYYVPDHIMLLRGFRVVRL
ncbi:MAG: formylglycine-generating enzyme family protein [Treponema sp.]|nr:formylglycine-generating enzyme family protein [Treponema sp.]